METQFKGITIYGNSIRGNNRNRHSYAHTWHAFLEEHGNAVFNTVYALYYNYESDHTGDFDFVIGIIYDDGKPAHEIKGGKYYVWDVGSDDPMDVADAWEDIWQRDDIKRAYGTDFEIYVPGETIKIYLSLQQ